MATTHKISLPQLAVACIRDALEAAGWATLISDQGAGAKLLESVIPDVTQPDDVKKTKSQTAARAENPSWCEELKEFEVTDLQRDKIRKALKYHLERGSLPPGRYTFAMLKAFGFSADE